MKGRESGMPDREYWNSFYDAECVVKAMLPTTIQGTIVEVGSGYGTFTLPVLRNWDNPFVGYDIEDDLIGELRDQIPPTRQRVQLLNRDIVENGIRSDGDPIGHVMLFNILHIEEPVGLLHQVHAELTGGGTVSVIHWKYDATTPRGPSMTIRPKPDDIVAWLSDAGFCAIQQVDLSTCCKYHYGITAAKPNGSTGH